MRIAKAGAVTAVLVLALAACGSDPAAGPAADASTVGTPSASPSLSVSATAPNELSPANLASELLGRLSAKGTFRMVSRTTTAGDVAVVTADLRISGDHAGLIATGGGRKLIKTGSSVYLKDAALTGDKARPWSELADGGRSSRSGKQLLRAAQVHALIGGAAHATTFQRADRITVDGVPAQEYVVSIDLARATAAGAMDGYLTAGATDSLPEALTVRIAVDARCLPVQLRFTLDDRRTGRADVTATFSRFGQKLTLTPPSAGRIASPETT
ncbi:hypothetical protein [Kribbella italica]|uniref:LppX_LprAFG lipoprotein n=1 Tax=Kribbella italica TaxID=1540520 RepID=A0A7W9MT59_9ACTN|nr:hypothetical protein [Kribbella italica]MBB5834780.1 hypothetical protein [Kribbella italica]